jgi:pyrimidine-nucleoside phosphorylase
MRAVDLIRRKRDGHALDAAEIRAFVDGVVDGSWPDYQVSALLMAIVLRGMDAEESATLTNAMVRSGAQLAFPAAGQAVVDKHSTGGVGDKVSLVLAPLAAACGLVVPMISGRGLGHTGGTLDKLESIPGFRTRLPLDEVYRVIDRTGCALIGQTDDMVPADRRLYALRDVTGTVESAALMSASILSKKIAEGIKGLVLDVKVGSGAFMADDRAARELAQLLIRIATLNGVRAEAVLTSMQAPLGRAIGNSIEVIEAIETLKGRGPADTEQLSVLLTARMLVLGGLAANLDEATTRVQASLASGEGLERFRQIIEAQGGDSRVVDDYALMPAPAHQLPLAASSSGVILSVDAGQVGRAAVALGAGRDRADAQVDPAAGIELLLTPGADVREGEVVLIVAGTDRVRVETAHRMLGAAIAVGDRALWAPEPLIRQTLSAGAA